MHIQVYYIFSTHILLQHFVVLYFFILLYYETER